MVKYTFNNIVMQTLLNFLSMFNHFFNAIHERDFFNAMHEKHL